MKIEFTDEDTGRPLERLSQLPDGIVARMLVDSDGYVVLIQKERDTNKIISVTDLVGVDVKVVN